MKLEVYQQIKDAAERKQRAADRARGAYDAAMERLREEFGCKTLKEAHAMLAQLRADEKEKRAKLETRLVKFQEKWKHLTT